MARSYSLTLQNQAANSTTTLPTIMIYQPGTAAGIRPKVFEIDISSGAAPNDYCSRYNFGRTTSTPTTGGGTQSNLNVFDPGDPSALMLGWSTPAGGAAASTVLAIMSVNQRATFRWIANTSKEFVIPNTAQYGIGVIIPAQSTAYNVDLTMMWEE